MHTLTQACKEAQLKLLERIKTITSLQLENEEEKGKWQKREEWFTGRLQFIQEGARAEFESKDEEIARLHLAKGGFKALQEQEVQARAEMNRLRLENEEQRLRLAEGGALDLRIQAGCARAQINRLRVENEDQRVLLQGVMETSRESGIRKREEFAAKDEEIARLRVADEVHVKGLQDYEDRALLMFKDISALRSADLAAKDVEIEGFQKLATDADKARLDIEQEKRAVQGELEEAQEELGYMVRADNARMTQVPPAGVAHSLITGVPHIQKTHSPRTLPYACAPPRSWF